MRLRRPTTAIIACAALAAMLCRAPACAQSYYPHPAVARIMAAENEGASFGSGSLVAVNDRWGLVITNWHVIRDTNGYILVTFPNGFRSTAAVARVDRDWDLAALVIWRPNVAPLPLAAQPPQPGELLTIAGYGKGSYRAVSGQCTQYFSPGGQLPLELVELAAPAREGDSGGPILNSRGELAGVLFGTAFGKTMGSYCGRVRWFLDPVVERFNSQASMGDAMLAQNLPSPTGMSGALGQPPPSAAIAASPPGTTAATGYGSAVPRTLSPVPNAKRPSLAPFDANRQPAAVSQFSGDSTPAAPGTGTPAAPTSPASAPWDLTKTFFAIIGVVLLSIQGLKLLGRAVG